MPLDQPKSYNRRQFLKYSKAELNVLIRNAVKARNAPLAEALQDVYTIKKEKNQEARRRFGV